MGKRASAIVSKCFELDRINGEATCEVCRLVCRMPLPRCIKKIPHGRISNLKVHADKHTETEIAKLDKIRAAAELNSPESGDLLRNAELFDVLGKLFSKPTPMDNDQQSSDQGSSASGSIQAPVFQTANVDQPQLRASGATGSTGITTGITNNSAKIDLSLHDDLESYIADFKRISLTKFANASDDQPVDMDSKLFDEVYAFLLNDSAKLFWHEYIAAHGKSDFDRFEAEYVANFRWAFQARRFEHLMEAELTLEDKMHAIKRLFRTEDNALALKIMLFCAPTRKQRDIKQITDALNSLGG